MCPRPRVPRESSTMGVAWLGIVLSWPGPTPTGDVRSGRAYAPTATPLEAGYPLRREGRGSPVTPAAP